MNGAVNNSLTFRLTLVLSLGIVALIVKDLVKAQKQMEANELLSDLEQYLHISRIQAFVDPVQQEIVDRISTLWSNDNYRGIMIPYEAWLKQQTDTLNR